MSRRGTGTERTVPELGRIGEGVRRSTFHERRGRARGVGARRRRNKKEQDKVAQGRAFHRLSHPLNTACTRWPDYSDSSPRTDPPSLPPSPRSAPCPRRRRPRSSAPRPSLGPTRERSTATRRWPCSSCASYQHTPTPSSSGPATRRRSTTAPSSSTSGESTTMASFATTTTSAGSPRTLGWTGS